jgi:8-amino-7-oxononanoate synthase
VAAQPGPGFVFDTAPTPATVGAALAGLQIAVKEPERRERALTLARRLAANLALPEEPAACIVPIVLGSPEAAVAASAHLAASGFLVTAIRPPSVPAGTARLRFTTTAAHRGADVDDAAAALATLRP